MRRVLRTRSYRNQLYRSVSRSNRVLGIGIDSKGIEGVLPEIKDKEPALVDTSSSDDSDDDNIDLNPLHERLIKKFANDGTLNQKQKVELAEISNHVKTQYVLKGAINNLSERIEMQNLLLDQARIMADKAIEVKEALLAEYNALVVESQTQKQTVELKNCQPTSAYAIFEDALQQANAKKLAEKEDEYRLHAETIAASLKKSVFELKQAPLLGFYDDRNAEYEEYLQQKAEAARAAEAARLAAEKAEKDKIEAAKAAAEKERIEAENARLAAERADAKKAAEALAFLNAEYGERVSNMVPKTVYVLKEATNDKLEYYEAQLETLAAQTAEKAAKLSDAEKAPTKEIVREVLQTAKSTGNKTMKRSGKLLKRFAL